MLKSLDFASKRKLSLTQLQTLQLVAHQVVSSLERSVRIPGVVKKEVATEILEDFLDDLEIAAPDFTVDLAIEISVKLLKLKLLESGSAAAS